MRKNFAIVGIAVFLLPGIACAADASGCSLKRIASVDMSAPIASLAVVPVEINGTQLQFFVDTGGILSSMSANAIQKLGLTPQLADEAEYQENGKRVAQTVKVKSLKIGDMQGSDMEFTVDSDSFVDTLDGRISPDILRGFDVDFDFAGNKLNFFSQDHCDGKVVYWSTAYTTVPMTLYRNGHIVIRVDLDGQTLDAVVDTGSTRSTISEAIATRAYGFGANSPGAEHIAGAKPDDVVQYRYRFKSLSMNGIAVSNPVIDVMPDLAEQQMRTELGKLADDPQFGLGKSPRLIIGMDVLRKLHIYIAYKESMLYITSATAH